jgi:hypothetical protein
MAGAWVAGASVAAGGAWVAGAPHWAAIMEKITSKASTSHTFLFISRPPLRIELRIG